MAHTLATLSIAMSKTKELAAILLHLQVSILSQLHSATMLHVQLVEVGWYRRMTLSLAGSKL